MAVTTEFLAKIKKAASLTASFFDSDITDLIEESRLELIRVGVSPSVANDETNMLVTKAIRVYVKLNYPESEAEATRLTASFEVIKSDLAMSTGYKTEG